MAHGGDGRTGRRPTPRVFEDEPRTTECKPCTSAGNSRFRVRSIEVEPARCCNRMCCRRACRDVGKVHRKLGRRGLLASPFAVDVDVCRGPRSVAERVGSSGRRWLLERDEVRHEKRGRSPSGPGAHEGVQGRCCRFAGSARRGGVSGGSTPPRMPVFSQRVLLSGFAEARTPSAGGLAEPTLRGRAVHGPPWPSLPVGGQTG